MAADILDAPENHRNTRLEAIGQAATLFNTIPTAPTSLKREAEPAFFG